MLEYQCDRSQHTYRAGNQLADVSTDLIPMINRRDDENVPAASSNHRSRCSSRVQWHKVRSAPPCVRLPDGAGAEPGAGERRGMTAASRACRRHSCPRLSPFRSRASQSRVPAQHLIEHIKRTSIHPTHHQPIPRNDQRRCPLTPREAIATESLDMNGVHPATAHSVSHQRTILALGATPKLKAAELEMVKQAHRDH